MPGNGITRAAVSGVLPRQILMGEKQAIHSFLQASDYDHRRNDNLWRLLDILSGIPQVYPTTVEEFIPQMINLDLVGGLSFTKGCYPGQEIVRAAALSRQIETADAGRYGRRSRKPGTRRPYLFAATARPKSRAGG